MIEKKHDIDDGLELVEEDVDDRAAFSTAAPAASEQIVSKRRQFGGDTESGIAYRERLAQERVEEDVQQRKYNLYVSTAAFILSGIILVGGIVGIVNKSSEKNLQVQTIAALQMDLQKAIDEPRVVENYMEADVVNGHDFSQVVCDYQNQLTTYVYNEVINDESLSDKHIALLDEYRDFAKKTHLDSMRTMSGVPDTWLSDLLTKTRISYVGRSKNPYLWVVDNDYDKLGLETDIVFNCYMGYGTAKQELIMTIVMHYSCKDDLVSKFSVYCSDKYEDIASVR